MSTLTLTKAGITIYHGDARDFVYDIHAESIITDPVWPNSVFPEVENPEQHRSRFLGCCCSACFSGRLLASFTNDCTASPSIG